MEHSALQPLHHVQHSAEPSQFRRSGGGAPRAAPHVPAKAAAPSMIDVQRALQAHRALQTALDRRAQLLHEQRELQLQQDDLQRSMERELGMGGRIGSAMQRRMLLSLNDLRLTAALDVQDMLVNDAMAATNLPACPVCAHRAGAAVICRQRA